MKKNQVAFPTGIDELEKIKHYGPLVFSEGQKQKQIFLASKNLETFYQESLLLPAMLEYLSEWDQELVSRLRFSQVVQNLCRSQDPLIVAHLVQSNLKSIDAYAICLGIPEIQNNALLKNRLMLSANAKQSRDRFYSALAGKGMSLVKSRVALSANSFDLLAAAAKNLGEVTVAVSSLVPATRTNWKDVSAEAQAWVYLVGILIRDNKQVELDEWIYSNAGFRQAFSLEATLESLAKLQAPISREKIFAQEALLSTAEAFWTEALNLISALAGPAKTEAFAKKVNALGLDYPVQFK